MASSSIGTAWIQIKPSLDGVSNSIKRELASAGDTGGETLSSNLLSKLSAKAGAIGGLASKAFDQVTSTVSSQIGDAVSRVDTLNNFPRVMQNLNVSAEDSGAAIQRMSDKLQGLPTSLDSGASAVQRFTSKNGDVQKSTDYFLSLNNALLAGGMGSEIQASAMEQLSQAYAKGKPDMQEWRSLQTAMPAQLNQVSKAMLGNESSLDGYLQKAKEYAAANPLSSSASELVEQLEGVKDGTGDMSTALGTALRTGIISMDDFMDTIVDLNENGTDEFANFEEQARDATGGIGTAFEVMKSRITQGIAAVIDEIGQERIADIATAIGNAFKTAGNIIADIVKFIVDNWGIIQPILIAVGAIAGTIATVSKALEAFRKVQSGVQTAVKAGGGALKVFNAILHASPIFLIAAALAAATAALVWFFTQTEVGKAVLQAVGQWFSGVFSAIGGFFSAVGQWFAGLFSAIGNFLSAAASILGGVAQWVWDHTLGPIIGFFSSFVILVIAILATIAGFVYEFVIRPVIDFVAAAIGTVVGIIGAIVGWINDNVITPIAAFFGFLWSSVVEGVTNFVETVKTVLGVIGNWIYNNVIKPVGDFFAGLWEGVKTGAEALGKGISQVFNTIGGFIKAPINAIIGAINGVIDAINSIQVPDWVPGIGGAHADFNHIPELATGGRVFGVGSETSDSNLYALSKGEYVIRAAAARQIGYDRLDDINDGKLGGGDTNFSIVINGYNKDPKELANEISRQIALRQKGVLA